MYNKIELVEGSELSSRSPYGTRPYDGLEKIPGLGWIFPIPGLKVAIDKGRHSAPGRASTWKDNGGRVSVTEGHKVSR